jgi:hypothetical protein
MLAQKNATVTALERFAEMVTLAETTAHAIKISALVTVARQRLEPTVLLMVMLCVRFATLDIHS